MRYEEKERRERGGDFNGEKGERLFLPWVLFLLPSPSFLMIFLESEVNRMENELLHKILDKLTSLDQRMTSMEQRMASIEQELAEVKQEVRENGQAIYQMKEDIQDIKSALKFHDAKLLEHEKEIFHIKHQ